VLWLSLLIKTIHRYIYIYIYIYKERERESVRERERERERESFLSKRISMHICLSGLWKVVLINAISEKESYRKISVIGKVM